MDERETLHNFLFFCYTPVTKRSSDRHAEQKEYRNTSIMKREGQSNGEKGRGDDEQF